MTDRFTVRAVIVGLVGLVGLSLVLAAFAQRGGDLFGYVATTGIGALAGILAKTSTAAEPVRIDQPDNDPIPVEHTRSVRPPDADR